MIGGDSKSLQADQYLLDQQRCAACTDPAEGWGSDIFIEAITVGERVRLFIDALDSLYILIQEGTVKTWGGVSKPGTVMWAWNILKKHAGCNSFPTQVDGNLQAHRMMMQYIATRLHITESITQWSESILMTVSNHYSILMTLENQINSTFIVHPLEPGYCVDHIVAKVPTLHCTFRWFKSIILDFCLNTAKGGQVRTDFSDTLLAVISPAQGWLSFMYAWMIKHIIAASDAWSSAPQLAQQARVMMYTILATCRLRDHTPARLIQFAVACQLLDPFMRARAHMLYKPSGVTAVTGKHTQKDLTFARTLWRHLICAHLLPELLRAVKRRETRLSEEGLEKLVGSLQSFFRTRGANDKGVDMTRTDSFQTTSDDLNARYSTGRRSKSRPLNIVIDPAERGTVVMPTLCELREPINALLSWIRGRYPGFIHFRGDAVFISPTPPEAGQSWSQLLTRFDVLCGCDRIPYAPCVCHADESSMPSPVTAEPEWLRF
jgi:hypothetical protein